MFATFSPAEIGQAIVGAAIVIYVASVGGKQLFGSPKPAPSTVTPEACQATHEALASQISNLQAEQAALRADLRAAEEKAALHREATQAALHKIELTLARMEGAGGR